MENQRKFMRVWHRWPGRLEWNPYLVTAADGEALLAKYPQYYSRTSNRVEKPKDEE